MASQKLKQTATTAKSTNASTGAGVAKRSHKKLRFHENGLLNIERKTGSNSNMLFLSVSLTGLQRETEPARFTITAPAAGTTPLNLQIRAWWQDI
ncbi:hypothetical protein J4E91_002643 [Alternaria rosae]|nr:hypothetical protein J4E91_002643 [Alternaria rosae]